MSEFRFGLQQFLEKYFENPNALELFTTPQTKEGREYLGDIDIAAAAKDYLLRTGAQQAVVEIIHCAEHTHMYCQQVGSRVEFYRLITNFVSIIKR